MAKIKLSAIGITAIRGTIGGTTFSANKGGIYVKNWAKPSNPMTPAQTRLRNMFGSVVRSWKELTASEVNDWDAYAQGRTTTDVLGESRTMSPRGAYISVNQNRLHVGLPIISAAPSPMILYAFALTSFDTMSKDLIVNALDYQNAGPMNIISVRISHHSPQSKSFKSKGQGVTVRETIVGLTNDVPLGNAINQLGLVTGDQFLVEAHMHNEEGLKSNVVTGIFTV